MKYTTNIILGIVLTGILFLVPGYVSADQQQKGAQAADTNQKPDKDDAIADQLTD